MHAHALVTVALRKSSLSCVACVRRGLKVLVLFSHEREERASDLTVPLKRPPPLEVGVSPHWFANEMSGCIPQGPNEAISFCIVSNAKHDLSYF